jgi:hypothetical protein
MLICVCLRILASSRIPDMILEDKPLISEVVLSHLLSIIILTYYHHCDRTTSEMRDLSLKIISEDSR